MIQKREILYSSFALLGLCSVLPQSAVAKRTTTRPFSDHPNVILINADDMGWADPSCYGGKLVETPNIDRLAKVGIRCTNGYVSAPVSGVSRTGLLTGSYQQRYGLQWNQDQWNAPGLDSNKQLPDEQKQIQTAFKEAGYATAMAGKIGINNYQPFDEFFSLTSAGCNYFPNEEGKYANVDVVPGAPKVPLNKNIMWGPEREGDEYITDRCGRQCIEFIEKNKENPFFFYMAFNAPHSPYHAKKSDLERVAHIESEVAKVYAAMVLAVDDNIGRILDYLEREGLRENTIVVMLSDNGPVNPIHLSLPGDWWPEGTPYHIIGQRGGLNGSKGTMWEAGIRIPYIISWPGRFDEGIVYDEPVSTLDIYPTLCSAARIKAPSTTQLDGVDLIPYFSNNYNEAPHEHLFWFANRMGAVRSGKWKMLIDEDYHYLFNLEEDMGETKNVMRENPEVMQELLAAYFNFRNQMPAYLNPFIRPIDRKDPAINGLVPVEPK